MIPLQEDKQPNEKMGKAPEQTLLQGGHTQGPETMSLASVSSLTPWLSDFHTV